SRSLLAVPKTLAHRGSLFVYQAASGPDLSLGGRLQWHSDTGLHDLALLCGTHRPVRAGGCVAGRGARAYFRGDGLPRSLSLQPGAPTRKHSLGGTVSGRQRQAAGRAQEPAQTTPRTPTRRSESVVTASRCCLKLIPMA